jgi:hypothetical protein
VEDKGEWYIAYHRNGRDGGSSYKRSLAMEHLYYNADGTIRPVPQTDEGVGPVGDHVSLAARHSGKLLEVPDGSLVNGATLTAVRRRRTEPEMAAQAGRQRLLPDRQRPQWALRRRRPSLHRQRCRGVAVHLRLGYEPAMAAQGHGRRVPATGCPPQRQVPRRVIRQQRRRCRAGPVDMRHRCQPAMEARLTDDSQISTPDLMVRALPGRSAAVLQMADAGRGGDRPPADGAGEADEDADKVIPIIRDDETKKVTGT